METTSQAAPAKSPGKATGKTPDKKPGKTQGEPRRRRRKEARPGEILKAALQVFAEKGFAASRIDDVARRAGVSKGTVYLYFDSKEALFEAVITATIGPEIDRAELLVATYRGSYTALLGELLSTVAAITGRKDIAPIPKMVIAESGNFPKLTRFYLDNVVKRAMRIFRTILERGIEQGEFRAVDAKHAARVLVAPVLLAVLWRQSFEPVDDEPFDVDGYFAAHRDLVLASLRCAAEPGR